MPGFIMPADRTVGFDYYQEFAPGDDALDQAVVVSLDEMVALAVGSFSGVLKVFETTELEPDAREFNTTRPGWG